jgi:hypothetical protein
MAPRPPPSAPGGENATDRWAPTVTLPAASSHCAGDPTQPTTRLNPTPTPTPRSARRCSMTITDPAAATASPPRSACCPSSSRAARPSPWRTSGGRACRQAGACSGRHEGARRLARRLATYARLPRRARAATALNAGASWMAGERSCVARLGSGPGGLGFAGLKPTRGPPLRARRRPGLPSLGSPTSTCTSALRASTTLAGTSSSRRSSGRSQVGAHAAGTGCGAGRCRPPRRGAARRGEGRRGQAARL